MSRPGDRDRERKCVVIARHDRRQHRLARGGEQRQADDRGKHGRNRDQKHGANGADVPGGAWVPIVAQRIGDDGKRKAAVPKHVKPCRCVRPRVKQAARREKVRKRQRVRDRHQRGEQIAGGQGADSPRAQFCNWLNSRMAVIRSLMANANS